MGTIGIYGRTKTTMCLGINKITKLRPYRQEPLGVVYNLLITKGITFWPEAPRFSMLLKTNNEHASIKDSMSLHPLRIRGVWPPRIRKPVAARPSPRRRSDALRRSPTMKRSPLPARWGQLPGTPWHPPGIREGQSDQARLRGLRPLMRLR